MMNHGTNGKSRHMNASLDKWVSSPHSKVGPQKVTTVISDHGVKKSDKENWNV